jgi:hypothetical protein
MTLKVEETELKIGKWNYLKQQSSHPKNICFFQASMINENSLKLCVKTMENIK